MKETPAKNENKQIPIIRANKEHIESLFGLFAAVSEFEKAQKVMPSRFEAIPYGKRDIRMLSVRLDKIVDDLCCTYPVEKLISIRRMLPHMSYKTHFGATASQIDEDECIIHYPDLDILAKYAHEQCKICIDQNCRRCKLGKVLDRVYTYDREESSWAYVDIENMG